MFLLGQAEPVVMPVRRVRLQRAGRLVAAGRLAKAVRLVPVAQLAISVRAAEALAAPLAGRLALPDRVVPAPEARVALRGRPALQALEVARDRRRRTMMADSSFRLCQPFRMSQHPKHSARSPWAIRRSLPK